MFQILMLGALMGILGQGARAVVGLKGMSDDAKALNKSPNALFDSARLLTSLLIGFLVGLAAALIYIIKSDIKNAADVATALNAIDWHVLVGFAASGYVGVDFLEGFIAQYLPQSAPGPAVQKPAPAGRNLMADRSLKFDIQSKAPTYSHDKAEQIVTNAFKTIGKSGVTDDTKLSGISGLDLYALLDSVNAQLDDTHLLPFAVANYVWAKSGATVADVVTTVEYAPTNPPPNS